MCWQAAPAAVRAGSSESPSRTLRAASRLHGALCQSSKFHTFIHTRKSACIRNLKSSRIPPAQRGFHQKLV